MIEALFTLEIKNFFKETAKHIKTNLDAYEGFNPIVKAML